ncbi:MAG: hypothetical protein V7K57_00455 [Nostoc sp.]|uniref:hypothetical protein n=1 Tax=Nostoc sp. TaxID=1180 RepID=UPI002FF9D511
MIDCICDRSASSGLKERSVLDRIELKLGILTQAQVFTVQNRLLIYSGTYNFGEHTAFIKLLI